MKEIIVGTRESKLALKQASLVVEKLKYFYPEYNFPIRGIKTKGDTILDVALAKIGDKGIFTKELEMALLNGEIDLAIHSMKDLPTELPASLSIGAVSEREYPGDVLISQDGLTLEKLSPGARMGTSSLRRLAQLLHFRPDFQIVNLRGNLDTRLRKLDEGQCEAVVLAFAGLHRMGWNERITQFIPFSICLPAAGQGSIGIEVRKEDKRVMDVVSKFDCHSSRVTIEAERALVKLLEGGCQVPIGALGRIKRGKLVLEGVVATLDGNKLVRSSLTGSIKQAQEIGCKLADRLLKMGAEKILKEIRQGL